MVDDGVGAPVPYNINTAWQIPITKRTQMNAVPAPCMEIKTIKPQERMCALHKRVVFARKQRDDGDDGDDDEWRWR